MNNALNPFNGQVIGLETLFFADLTATALDWYFTAFPFGRGEQRDQVVVSADGAKTVVTNQVSEYVYFSGCGEGLFGLNRSPETFENKLKWAQVPSSRSLTGTLKCRLDRTSK